MIFVASTGNRHQDSSTEEETPEEDRRICERPSWETENGEPSVGSCWTAPGSHEEPLELLPARVELPQMWETTNPTGSHPERAGAAALRAEKDDSEQSQDFFQRYPNRKNLQSGRASLYSVRGSRQDAPGGKETKELSAA